MYLPSISPLNTERTAIVHRSELGRCLYNVRLWGIHRPTPRIRPHPLTQHAMSTLPSMHAFFPLSTVSDDWTRRQHRPNGSLLTKWPVTYDLVQPKPWAKSTRFSVKNISGNEKKFRQRPEKVQLKGVWKPWHQDRDTERNSELEP